MTRTRSAHDLALFCCAAFAGGIVAASVFAEKWFITAAVLFALVALAAAKQMRYAHAVLFAAFFCGGAFVYVNATANINPDRLKLIYDRGDIPNFAPVKITGVVTDAVQPAAEGAFIEIAAHSIKYRGDVRNTSGRVRYFVPLRDELQTAGLAAKQIRYGDVVSVHATPDRENRFSNPGVLERKALLDQQGIDLSGSVKSPLLIKKISEGGLSPVAYIFAARAWVIEQFRSRLSPEAAGVMIASLLGDKYFLDRDTSETFRQGGTFHVLVISGLHITFIGGLIWLLAARFTASKRWRFGLSCLILWVYTLAVGADVPVVRATMMFSFVGFGYIVRREPLPLNSLAVCAMLLLAWRPQDLFSPSFQLTLLSVTAIVGTAVPLISKLRKIGSWTPAPSEPLPPKVHRSLQKFCETLFWRPHEWHAERSRNIWNAELYKRPYLNLGILQKPAAYIFEALLVSTIVQIWLLPASIIYFHRVTPGGIFLNLFIGVLIAFESFAAIGAVFFGLVADMFALPFVAAAETANKLMIGLQKMFIDLQIAGFRLPAYEGEKRIVYLCFLVCISCLCWFIYNWDVFKRSSFLKKTVFRSAAVLSVLLVGAMIFHPFAGRVNNGKLNITFLDVGQGDAAFIEFPNGKTMLIDAGGRVQFDQDDADDGAVFTPDVAGIGEIVTSEYIWYLGYDSIDFVVASHSDSDHAQGLTDVLRNFTVGEVYVGRNDLDTPEIAPLKESAAKQGLEFIPLDLGDRFEIGDVLIEILHPRPDKQYSSNDGSVVMALTYGSNRILFTGDIERAAESDLLTRENLVQYDVVKVPHHGSRTSSTQEFINRVKPLYAIISVGRRSMFGHPHEEVVERWQAAGAEVLTTGKSGTVRLETDGGRLAIMPQIK